MNLIDNIEFKKLNRISPSQFYSMKCCIYKTLLADAFGKKPLLPVSPAAYYGIVLHKMLEYISKGEIINEIVFNSRFDEEILLLEDNLQQKGYSFFVPLQMNVKDFGIKKIQLKKHLCTATKSTKELVGKNFISEKWFESKDKLIGGKIDLIIEAGEEIEIIDFKTGAITEDILDDGELFAKIKEEYKFQLKLYAQLYYETIGKFPTKLSLIDLAKQKYTVIFSPLECKTISDEAKKILDITNENISKGIFVAHPSEVNCKYCLYRPACSFFLKLIESSNSFNDISGIVKNVVKHQNGNVSVFLESVEKIITITGFNSEKYNEFVSFKGRKINFFNLWREATKFVYSATKTTIIYE